jgi:ribosomal protein S1
MRNKILKYGANLALERGDLAVGYVTNIGKAGCFVQIGHNCTVRAGLNELNDSPNFDFATEMPLGRLVLGRISKVDSGDNKRFHFSTRQSITVYGVGVIDRSKLAVDDEAEVIIMAIAEGKAFAQIKGTYIKIKVKQITADLKIGDHVTVSLKKVTKEKISSIFLKKLPASECLSEEQKRI